MRSMYRRKYVKASPRKISRAAAKLEAFNKLIGRRKVWHIRNPAGRRETVIMMGLPGAGKSYVAEKKYGKQKDAVIISSDTIAASYLDYNIHEPGRFAQRAGEDADKMFLALLHEGSTRVIVFDGTGKTYSNLIKKIELARSYGYSVKVLYVMVSLQIALERNRKRAHKVSESFIIESAEKIESNFNKIGPYVDEVEVVRNY